MFLTALALTLASAPASQASPAEITLNSQDRWALVTGLRHRLGGPFVIANLADADAICKTSVACLSAAALDRGQIEPANLTMLLAETEIGGRNAVALVALRTGEITARKGLRLTVSVFDTSTARWTHKDLWIDGQSTAEHAQMKRIYRYEDSVIL